MLQITEEGRATVASLEFAEEIGRAVNVFRTQGESELDIDQMCRLSIAIALTESDAELKRGGKADTKELARIMIEHADEIDAVFEKCVEMLNSSYIARLRN